MSAHDRLTPADRGTPDPRSGYKYGGGPRGFGLWTHSDGVEIDDTWGNKVTMAWPEAILHARSILDAAEARELLTDGE